MIYMEGLKSGVDRGKFELFMNMSVLKSLGLCILTNEMLYHPNLSMDKSFPRALEM